MAIALATECPSEIDPESKIVPSYHSRVSLSRAKGESAPA